MVKGLFYGGGTAQLRSQLIGSATCVIVVTSVALLVMYAIRSIRGSWNLRVSKEGELYGLDLHEHGISAYPEYVISAFAAPAGMGAATVGPEIRAATHPSDGKPRFSLIVEGPSKTELAKVWADLCSTTNTASSDFKTIYPFLTTVEGNRFRFRGGDPETMRASLDKLLKARLTQNFTARVET